MEYRKVQRAEHGSCTASCKRLSHRTVSTSSCWVLLTAALLVIPSSRAYTLDTTNTTVLFPETRTGDSMFGYALAFWDTTGSNGKWLLVGAPYWKKTKQEGALFQCFLDGSPPFCRTLEVDRGEETCKEERCENIGDSQRLGATLAVHDDIALVCAPNWLYKTTNKYGKSVGAPVGKCFYSMNNALSNFTGFSSVYDLKQTNENLYFSNTGYCQAGFSALLLPEEQKVALGAPGCYAWTGDVLVGKPHSKEYINKSQYYNLKEDFGITSPSVSSVEPWNRYMGYSIAKGTFNNKLAVVAGSPKAAIYSFMTELIRSSVSVMERLDDKKLKIWKQLYPPMEKGWYFSYCGYSIAVGDLNGDGLDDVAVGCPNYDEDKGAVLVYYQIKEADGTFKMELEKPDYRLGPQRGARFGSSVTVLGDIDGDGYQELAVGSPFSVEDNGGSGRLFIYCSTRGQDLPMTPCQEVAAPLVYISDLAVQNFGWSATSQDSFVAVSAPASEAVLVFRTRRVVQLNVTVDAPDELDVSHPCEMEDGELALCVNIRVCLQYTIRNGEKDDRKRDMSVDVQLQPMKSLSFATGAKSTSENFSSIADMLSCKLLLVYDRKKNDEIVEYEITARGIFTPAEDDTVVLDERQGLDSRAMLRMKLDCPESTYETCRPDMRVSIDLDGDFVLRVQERVQLTVTITVSGDPAYYPKLVISSEGFMAPSSDIMVAGARGNCSEINSTHDIYCSLGGVLQNTTATVTLSLSGSEKFNQNLRNGNDFFTVRASATCSSSIKEPSSGNDTKLVDITVRPKNLVLSRFANPDELDFTSWSDGPSSALESRGPKMVHSYEVDNPNQYDLYDVSLTIYWPQKHNEGYMLYTSRAPSFQRSDEITGYCEALAGGSFDEMHLHNASTTNNTVISVTQSTTSGEQLGSADINPLTIQCFLGDISQQGSIVVEVESYAFYQTFDKLKDSPVRTINSVGVATPGSAPLGKSFTNTTTESITIVVIYPQEPFPWYWVVVAVMVGLILIIIMGVLFKKYVIDRKKNPPDLVVGNDAVDEEEMDDLGEKGEDAAEKEPLDRNLAGETSEI